MLAARDTEVTRVIFRVWRRYVGDVIALFPEIDEGRGMCRCYQHIGQHGDADYRHVIAETRPASPAEYAALKRELESIGYNLRVTKRGKL